MWTNDASHTTVTRRGRWTRTARALGLAGCLAWAGSCTNDLVTGSQASSKLVLELIEGAPGSQPGTQFSGQLQSDVVTVVRQQGAGGDTFTPTVFEDLGRVAGRLAFKEPGTSANPTSPTSANWITVTRYRVEYKRGDGRNVPGVDVPHPFDGGLTFTVIDVISAEFTLVRAQAKLEPPLLALRGLGGAVAIATVAEVTFFGHDQTGAAVQSTGFINVNFADFGDPTT